MLKTETQDLQDQYWKSMTGMDCDKQKVMASRKSSIPVFAHTTSSSNLNATVILPYYRCSLTNDFLFCLNFRLHEWRRPSLHGPKSQDWHHDL